MNFRHRIQRKGAKAQRRSVEQVPVVRGLSLARGFSPVLADTTGQSRFNGLADYPRACRVVKTVETVFPFRDSHTRLKPGANERSNPVRIDLFALRLRDFAPLR